MPIAKTEEFSTEIQEGVSQEEEEEPQEMGWYLQEVCQSISAFTK